MEIRKIATVLETIRKSGINLSICQAEKIRNILAEVAKEKIQNKIGPKAEDDADAPVQEQEPPIENMETYDEHLETLIPTHVKSVDSRSRSVGPKHDPYLETTYTVVTKDGHRYEFTGNALGLSRIKKDNVAIKESRDERDATSIAQEFEKLVGMPISDIDEYISGQPEDPMGKLSDYE